MTEQTMARHWIGGDWADSAKTSDSVNPATGEVIGTYADADAGVGRAAIDAAARSFAASTWRLDPMLRATALSHLADAYTSRAGDIVDTLCRENGELGPEAGYEAHFIPPRAAVRRGTGGVPGRPCGRHPARAAGHVDPAAGRVPLEYSIEWLTCAVASRFDAVLVG